MTLYQHIGVAVAFSPRLDALLAETAYRASHLATRISLFHVGAHSPEKATVLANAIQKNGLPEHTAIHWLQGPPDDAILEAIDRYQVDLLFAGALEKQTSYRYYLGSVAHNLVRKAPCSLVLFTEPKTEPQPVRRIVLVTEFSEGALVALTKVIRFAEEEKAEVLHVLRVVPEYGETMALSGGIRREKAYSYQNSTLAEEKSLLQDLVDAAGHCRVPIEAHCVEGHAGYIASQFVQQKKADLLVMPSITQRSHFLQRVFPSDMEWLLREIPCTLWVVRERLD